MADVLPWLAVPFRQIDALRASGRLPQALLVHDRPGAGGNRLLRHFAQVVLCTADTPPCGSCSGCRRVLAGEHPDLSIVAPDPEAKLAQIGVDQIRELSSQLSMSSYEGRGTVAVIAPADAMNRFAANALLKTLEEPRRDAHLLLLTCWPSRLPATVLSRCQRLAVPAPTREQALAFLAAARPGLDWAPALDVLGLAPLEAADHDAVELAGLRDDVRSVLRDALAGRVDAVRVADRWSREAPELRLRAIENQLTARVLGPMLASGESVEMRGSPHLSGPGSDINIRAFFTVLDLVRELRRQWSTALNKSLLLEGLLWRLHDLAPRGAAPGR